MEGWIFFIPPSPRNNLFFRPPPPRTYWNEGPPPPWTKVHFYTPFLKTKLLHFLLFSSIKNKVEVYGMQSKHAWSADSPYTPYTLRSSHFYSLPVWKSPDILQTLFRRCMDVCNTSYTYVCNKSSQTLSDERRQTSYWRISDVFQTSFTKESLTF